MASPTEEQKHRLDRKIERIEKHRSAISSRKILVKGISKKDFHSILDKASQPVNREAESDSK
jgi:hypothetical protein